MNNFMKGNRFVQIFRQQYINFNYFQALNEIYSEYRMVNYYSYQKIIEWIDFNHEINYIDQMLDDSLYLNKAITCLIHRRQKATHICTQFNCELNPILCAICFADQRCRMQHGHESSIRPLTQGIEWLTGIIKSQSKSIQLIYERTIGSRQCQIIKSHLQKGPLLVDELNNNLQNLRLQLELEIDLLTKQFQKQMQIQKQGFIQRLDEYKRLFTNSIDSVKKQCLELLSFQNSLKYYNNANNFSLKLATQTTQRKSQVWIQSQKRNLLKISQILQNSSFSNSIMQNLNRLNKSSLMNPLVWKGNKNEGELQKNMKSLIKSVMNGWIQLIDIIEIDQNRLGEYSTTNKFISRSISM